MLMVIFFNIFRSNRERVSNMAIHPDPFAYRVFLHAQTSATGFYQRHGFHALGEEFMDAGIPHRYMERNLP